MGWAGKKNGELLELIIAENFDVLITVDQNISSQQNLAEFPFALVVLVAKKHRYDHLEPLMAELLSVLPDLKASDFIEIGSK